MFSFWMMMSLPAKVESTASFCVIGQSEPFRTPATGPENPLSRGSGIDFSSLDLKTAS